MPTSNQRDIVLGVVVLGALAIAGAAYIALVCVFAILAPIVIVLSTIPPMRWLGLLWLKALTITLLSAPANAILLTIAIKTFAAVSKSGTVGGWVGGMLLNVGAWRDGVRHQEIMNSRQMALQGQQKAEYRWVLNEAHNATNEPSYPAHLSRQNYDTTGLFAEQIVGNVPEAPYESAYRLSMTLNQGMLNTPNLADRESLAMARRNLYDTIGQQNNFTATEFAGRLNNWAKSNEVGVTLPTSVVSDIQALYYLASRLRLP